MEQHLVAGGLALVRQSTIHGNGVFAASLIPCGTEILEYTGEIITKEESARRCEEGNPFIFTLDERHDLDGAHESNPARFINHGCEPNCEALQDSDNRIWITALRDIAPGEELSFNYGYDLEHWRDHACRCGSGSCLGYMVAAEFHDHVRAQLSWTSAPA